jgi:hypothetical protein
MALLNVNALMKEPVLGKPAPKAGFLKKKAFAKPSQSTEVKTGLLKRLTGK